MGVFGTNGYDDYPNLSLDREAAHSVSEWDNVRLNSTIEKYRKFGRKKHILQHHVEQAEQIHGWLEFEADYRDGLYQMLGEIGVMLNSLAEQVDE